MGEIYTALEAFNSKKVNNRNRYIIKYYPIRQYCILFFDPDVFIVHIFDLKPPVRGVKRNLFREGRDKLH